VSDQAQDTSTVTNAAGGTQPTQGQPTPAPSAPPAAGAAPAPTQPTEGAKPGEAKPTEQSYEIKAPEGVELNQETLGQFTTIAKELGLKPADAQRVADLAIKQEQARAEAWQAQVQDWATAVQADPVLGKPEALAAARKVIDKFGDDELKAVLNTTGYGNHPALVRLMHKVGQAMSEDTFTAGRSQEGGPKKSAADILYGN
jgi:hypothetical protein